MAKKLKTLTLCIGNSDRWFSVDLDNCDGERGYFLGSVQLSFDEGVSASFHVEAIEATEVNGISPLRSSVTAVNPSYQGRLDNYLERNDGEIPCLVKRGRKKYFIHITPYAR